MSSAQQTDDDSDLPPWSMDVVDQTGLVIDDNLNTTTAITTSPQKSAEEVDVLSPGLRIAVDEGDDTKSATTTHSSSTT
ncbi:hypothetical protein T4E_10427 [Trichinella pseudospiralis]|uniref:Uncharacterized protein n=1 Tax=Trichinella pseudospiralis TaxID=6337 RepID=A0A0V0Y2B4_TRIPS|nr:hypothetical protein T4E_10427 [Trichinella pseudospiralis]